MDFPATRLDRRGGGLVLDLRERGILDLFARHETSSTVVVIELKTAIVDVDEVMGTLDKKRRLAARIAAERGWRATQVSAWLIVGDSSVNRRRVAEHHTIVSSALPRDGRALAAFFLHPERGPRSGVALAKRSRPGSG